MANVTLDEGSGQNSHLKGTSGAAQFAMQGTGINVGASVDVNSNVGADVDAAVAAATGLRLVGFACREMAGAPAVAAFIIVHGATGAGGTAVVPVELAANESRSEWFGPEGIACPNGISIDWLAGAVDVHLFYKTVA